MTTESHATTEPTPDVPPHTESHPAVVLRAVVVRYEHRPDRCTVCPRSMTRDELTTAWITADVADFYDLEEAR